jgi:PAS domain S-box-containing protein
MNDLDALFGSDTGRAVLDAILGSMPSFAFIADCGGRILRASRFVSEVSGVEPAAFEGQPVAILRDILKTADRNERVLPPEELPITRALNGETVLGAECTVMDRSGARIPLTINAAPFRTADGKVIGAITSAADLRRAAALERDLRAAVAEKEMLYRELAHRVKNHFQLISGLVALETRETGDGAAELGGRMVGRLKMLSAVYDRMNQADAGGRICARPFLEDVVVAYRTPSISIEVSAPDGLSLDPDWAGPLGMLVNEAVNNSYKHAFPDGGGRIAVSLRPSAPDRLELAITDNGVGWAGPVREGSQGLQLMRLLARRMGGEMMTSKGAGPGASVVVDLPASPQDG